MTARTIKSAILGASLLFGSHGVAEQRTVLVEEFGATW